MYRFKYYYKNGSIKLSNNVYNDVKNFDSEIQKLTKNKNFKTTHAEKQDFDKFLKLAINEYGKNFNDIYRMDIINNNTNEILGYVDKSECLVDGKKGHLLYDSVNDEVINVKVDKIYNNGTYRFKFYYNDGTSSLSGGYAVYPTALYNDFDGLLDWDEFDNLSEENITTKKILELAVRAYKDFEPDFHRIEIINDKTNEIIDYIDVKNVK